MDTQHSNLLNSDPVAGRLEPIASFFGIGHLHRLDQLYFFTPAQRAVEYSKIVLTLSRAVKEVAVLADHETLTMLRNMCNERIRARSAQVTSQESAPTV
jgi:hypothetical protein